MLQTSTTPHNLDAERAVLSSIILDHDSLLAVVPILTPDDFFDPVHRVIFAACLELFEQRKSADFVTLNDYLSNDESVQRAGGNVFLAELGSYVQTASLIVNHAQIVREKSIGRALIKAGRKITDLGTTENESAVDLIEKAHREIIEISFGSSVNKPESLADINTRRYDEIVELQSGDNPKESRAVKTEFSNIDYYFNGFAAGSLTIVAARPGLGKTTFAINLAVNAATKKQRNVLIFSLEMAKEEVSDRIVAGATGLSMWKMQKGAISEEDIMRMGAMTDEFHKLPIFIDDDADSTIANIRAKALRHQMQFGLDLVIIDYLQLIEVPSSIQKQNRTQEVSYISRSLKKLAKELKIPVVALSQLNREIEKRPQAIPQLADLRDSGSIEQDADNVLMLWREGKYNEDCENPNITTVFIRKHRQGPEGIAELDFDAEKMLFTPHRPE